MADNLPIEVVKIKPELSAPSENQSETPGERNSDWIKAWRFRWALLAVVFSVTTKLLPLGPLMWLAKGYGHDFTTPVIAYMLTRSHFSSAAKCGAVTLMFFLLSEAFQFFQFLIPGHDASRPARFGVFDPWDFLAFTLGTGVALGIDLLLTRRALEK